MISLHQFGLSAEKDYFLENLAMLIESGMDISSVLQSLTQDSRSRRMQKIIQEIKLDIEAGATLSAALERSALFPSHAVALIKVGEETGQLPENLAVVARQIQKQRLFQSKIRSAMAYPLLVISLSLVIGLGIAWFILPRLAGVFDKLKIELPLITKLLIAVGNFFGAHGTLVIPLAVFGIAAIFYFFFGLQKTKFLGHAILFHIPGIKKLLAEIELARFGYLLGVLLDAGLSFKNALNSLAESTSFHRYRLFYNHLRDSVEEGNSFQKSFALFKHCNSLVPLSIQQMIATGEKSGRLPEIFKKIGEIFEAKTEMTTKNLMIILEPLLLVFVWCGVLLVALAIILPIYTLTGSLNK